MLVSLLTQVTGWPRRAGVHCIFLWDSQGGEHLVNLSFTLRCCDLLLLFMKSVDKTVFCFVQSHQKRYTNLPFSFIKIKNKH